MTHNEDIQLYMNNFTVKVTGREHTVIFEDIIAKVVYILDHSHTFWDAYHVTLPPEIIKNCSVNFFWRFWRYIGNRYNGQACNNRWVPYQNGVKVNPLLYKEKTLSVCIFCCQTRLKIWDLRSVWQTEVLMKPVIWYIFLALQRSGIESGTILVQNLTMVTKLTRAMVAVALSETSEKSSRRYFLTSGDTESLYASQRVALRQNEL